MNHNDTREEKNMKDEILGKIHANTLTMRPKLYFTLQLVALALVALAILVISVFICNFILFSIRINSHDALLGFGVRGFLTFLRFFPWSLLILDAGLVVLLQWLLRQFRFGYKSPMLFLFLGLALATGASGLILDRETSLNDMFLREADEHRLPTPLAVVYGRARHMPLDDEGFCKCTVSAIASSSIMVVDPDGATLTVVFPPDEAHATTTGLAVGDQVLVAGDRDGSIIHAFGVQKLPADGYAFYAQTGMMGSTSLPGQVILISR